MTENVIAKPFLRWAGSKKKTIPELIKYWNEEVYDTYIEPFVGSGQLFFSINCRKAIISDINQELINTYLQIQKTPSSVSDSIKDIGKITKEKYYKVRSLAPDELSDIERAARFIFLNRYCFNGLYRTNKAGQFNVPFATTLGTGELVTKDQLMRISQHLQVATILNCDFESTIKNHLKPDSFIYLDPPYAINNKRVFQQYDPASFGTNDIDRLKKLLTKIDHKKAHFVLSYAYTKESVDHFKTWKRKRIITQRNIAGFAENRKRAAELLVTNIM